MKKKSDCVDMKRRARERVFEETKTLSLTEEVVYFRREADAFWEEVNTMRAALPRRSPSG